MVLSLRALKLKTRMVLILGLMALLQTGFIGLFALHYLNQSLDEQIGKRALHIAQTIATMPEIKQAVAARDSDRLNPLAKNLAERNQARFVVIGDYMGIRLAHPLAERLANRCLMMTGITTIRFYSTENPMSLKLLAALGQLCGAKRRFLTSPERK